MQVSLDNTTVLGANSSNIPPHPPSIQEPPKLTEVDLDMHKLDTPDFSSCGSPLYVINTAFDHEHELNKKLGFVPTNKKNRYRYTQRERSSVEIGMKCASLEDFQKRVSLFYFIDIFSQIFIHQIISQLSSGAKTTQGEYIRLSHNNLNGWVLCYLYSFEIQVYCNNSIDSQRVRINDKNGDVMAIIIPDMPNDIRESLLNDLELAHPGVLEVMDSEKGGEKAKFQHVHYQYWNRYHINVSFSFST